MSSVWPILHYDDTDAALRYLVDMLGFREIVTARDETGLLVHAELGWPGGGHLLFGSTTHTDSVHGAMRAGTAATYLVTTDVDAVHARITASGAGTVLVAPGHSIFGSGSTAYAFTAADPEGNLWTFGTHAAAPQGSP
ncbi:VOC family protein [Mycobacteroides abscessus]|uniref:VOC family protein n=1 Tax=Mycobacteroides abscessus TaxID=36809 RepID=UPI000241C678|nr:VOC family protein [Mycobacteroides abscessus]EHM21725.1 glyoxalase/bleomycin resistance protein/dioxygenase [Mycobacteroides abscessus subsp. massiliense CCUG 48898 = JCM 15300]EIV69310.1 glyoxalase/bleomycin resistance protein/dioxygenase [Mycobacteroides abscessus subsp. massiliense CCUG 48898 = JCM 15300]MDM2402580.1 VOC family protein [Mycobacteroides abscessus]MDM2412885.1 VOC family protein [Mycobacteroides abscessus]ORA87640.1 glyoxalase [Mycobacteroides abscessus subsp. massiliense